MTRQLMHAHHNVLGYIHTSYTLDDMEYCTFETRPRHYIVIGARHLQPAIPAEAQHAIRLDLLDVVLRARFLGVGDVDLLNMLTGILSQE